MQAITINDLVVHNEVPTILDLRLAETLGYTQPRDIRKIIKRNVEELGRYGDVCATMSQTKPDESEKPRHRGAVSGRRGPLGEEFHLNEAQSLLVCMKADTDKAADAREQIIRVFMEWRRRGPGVSIEATPSPASFPLPDLDAPLAARVNAIREARALFGKVAARALWTRLGLPAIDVPDAADDGAAVLARIMKHPQSYIEGDSGVWIANPLAAALFADTPMEGRWLSVLRGLRGATAGRRMSFEGRQMRTTFIPGESLPAG